MDHIVNEYVRYEDAIKLLLIFDCLDDTFIKYMQTKYFNDDMDKSLFQNTFASYLKTLERMETYLHTMFLTPHGVLENNDKRLSVVFTDDHKLLKELSISNNKETLLRITF